MSEQREVIGQAVERFGVDKQITKTMEECAELIQALAKWLASDGNHGPEIDYHVAEEVADVQIMLEQIMYMFDNHYEVGEYKQEKLKRLSYLLEHGKYPDFETETGCPFDEEL